MTTSEIQSAFYNKATILLIKEYRQRTGLGLKDSKDAIESVFFNQNYENRVWDNPALSRMLELFANAKYVGSNPYVPPSTMQRDAELHNAIEVMYGNWKHLGYVSYKAGVLAIMGNF